MRSQAIEAPGPNCLLRVEFIPHGDRYRQLISLVNASGEIQPLLESIEGTATDDWPPSPPFQSLSVETLPDGRTVALLVGMAGGSHWSASIEPIAGACELLFDIACRHAKEPQWLESRYCRLSQAAKCLTIRCDQAIATDDSDVIAIKPAITAKPGTTRWKFAVHLTAGH